MATKKTGKVARPTLEEIKARPGKYVVVSYRGYESGGFSIPAPDVYDMGLPAGYTPRDILIRPWEWDTIPLYWLDDSRFAGLYEKIPEIVVEKTNTPPVNEDLYILPDELEKILKPEYKRKAFWVATQPYLPDLKTGNPQRATADFIQMKDMETTDDSPQQLDFLTNTVVPILEAVLIYEERLGNRPDLIADVEARLEDIGTKKVYGGNRRRRGKTTRR
jgi:hypothetical protein